MTQFNKATSSYRTKTAAGASYPTSIGAASVVLFPEVPYDSITERLIHNPSATASLAVRLCPPVVDAVGNPNPDLTPPSTATPASQPSAAINGGGSITIPALGTLTVAHCGAIQAIGAGAGQAVTAMER